MKVTLGPDLQAVGSNGVMSSHWCLARLPW